MGSCRLVMLPDHRRADKKLTSVRLPVCVLSVTAFVAALLLPPAAGAAATAACLPQAPPAPQHAASAVSPTGLSTTPSSAIGQIGTRPPAPGQPAWNGDDRVDALAQIGNTIYAGGKFDTYEWNGVSYPRHNVVAFDATTGQPTSFAPDVDGEVLTLTPSCTGSLLYLGGSFHHVGGLTRSYAAKVAVTDGSLSTWDPEPNGIVESIALLHAHLVLAGRFTSISGVARSNWASVSQTAAAATADSWLSIPISGSDPAGPQRVVSIVPNHQGSYAVAVGNFNDVGGVPHRRIAVLRLADASATLMPWATPVTSNATPDTGYDCSSAYADPERDVTWTPDDQAFVTASTGGPHASTICDSIAKWAAAPAALAVTTAMPLAVQYTGGDTLSSVVCSAASCIASGHNRWANNPPIYYHTPVNGLHSKPVTPCSPLAPVNLATGNAGYNCQDPGQSLERPGILEVGASSFTATAWNPGRSRQQSMHDAMLLTPAGLVLGSDGDTFAGQPHNDIVVVPFAQ